MSSAACILGKRMVYILYIFRCLRCIYSHMTLMAVFPFQNEAVTIPWLKMITSIESWSIFITHTCDNFMYILIATYLPLYLKEVLKIDIENVRILHNYM